MSKLILAFKHSIKSECSVSRMTCSREIIKRPWFHSSQGLIVQSTFFICVLEPYSNSGNIQTVRRESGETRNSGQAISSTAEKEGLFMCHDKTLVTWPHLTTQAGLENIVSRWVAKGKKLDFENTVAVSLHQVYFSYVFFYSLSHSFLCLWSSQSICFDVFSDIQSQFVQTVCRNTTFFREECLITPAKSDTELSQIFLFILYFLITETYILLLIWVHALSHLQTTCSKIIVPLLY